MENTISWISFLGEGSLLEVIIPDDDSIAELSEVYVLLLSAWREESEGTSACMKFEICCLEPRVTKDAVDQSSVWNDRKRVSIRDSFKNQDKQ